MTSRIVNPMHKRIRLRSACLAIAGLVALIAAGDHAGAASGRRGRSVESIKLRAAGQPIMAIVSLRNQRITVYDANGWILRAPVSSGQKGRETPAGIFTVIQKEAEHYSNLYDDAYMPHMQRITWSGIALHGGLLPGYPASHGCIRMPFDFAARLFGATRLGMRVIVAPHDVAPIEIVQPALFTSKPAAGASAAARAAEAHEAARKADQARLAAVTASREAVRAMVPVRMAENLKLRAETQLAAAERALESAISVEAKERAEEVKAKAVARVAELEAQWAAAKAELQPKLDAVAPAREAAVAAETARVSTAEAARELEPVSVFISRKTQRLYVRRALSSHPGESGYDPGCRSSDGHARLHRHGADEWRHRHALERHIIGRRTVTRRGGRATCPAKRRPRCRVDVDGSGRREHRARPDCHSAGRIGSSRRDGIATIFPDHLGRSVELGNRQRHGFRGSVERPAARSP
jgi:L,D-transpeptidase catalytic domain